jgi:nucleoside-diphosphate-sugar epimerase
MFGVTGSSGVLGTIICEKLKQNNIPFSCFEGDLRDWDSLYNWLSNNKITYIIHLASKVAIKEVQNNIDEAYEVNVSGTINLIKAIKTYKKSLGLFYASSSHVYKSSDLPLSENDILEPQNSYGLTKYISELLLLDFVKNFKNLDLCIGRIFSFYHQSQLPPFLYPTLMERFKNEDLSKPFKLFGANSTRDFLNAETVCDYIIKLTTHRYQGVINIASGKSIKISEFVQNLAPVGLVFDTDATEIPNHLNADVTLLNSFLKNDK